MTQGYIAIGYMCNQACSFCPCSKAEKRYPIPDLEMLEKVVENMIQTSSIDSIVVSGGEPTIHPDFIDFIRYLCEKKLKITILTNSERFSDKKFTDRFLSAVRTELVELITTIHSQSEEEHEAVNGSKGSFQRTIDGMLQIQSGGIHTTVKHCITKANYKDLYQFYKFIDNVFPQETDIQLCSIDYCGLSEENKYDYMVIFPELYPYFEEMFDDYIKKLDVGNKRHMYCINMPLCSLDPYDWDFVAPKIKSYSSYSAPTQKGESNVEDGRDDFIGTLGEGCRKCKAEPLCAGTYRTAFEYFGDRIICPYKK